MGRFLVPVSSIFVFLTACAPPPSQQVRAMAYRCENGGIISARVDPAQRQTVLFLPERTVTLDQVPAASGASYSDGTTIFWTRGNEARIEFGDRVLYDNCRPVRFEAGP